MGGRQHQGPDLADKVHGLKALTIEAEMPSDVICSQRLVRPRIFSLHPHAQNTSVGSFKSLCQDGRQLFPLNNKSKKPERPSEETCVKVERRGFF